MSDLITYYNYRNSSDDSEEIDDCMQLTVSLGSEVKNNNMKITLKNNPIGVFSDGTIRHRWVNEDTTPKFNAVRVSKGSYISEELIEVYATYTDTDPSIDVESSDYLLITGVINKGSIKDSEDNNEIELTCVDRTMVILDMLTIPQAYNADDSWTSPTIIQNLVRNAGESFDSIRYAFDSSGNKGTKDSGYPFLIDARLFSEGVKSSGTATSYTALKLIDSGATFITDGIAKGYWVRDSTDESYAYVVSVDSESQVTLSKDIISSGDGYQISDGFIQDTRPDGTAFPALSFNQIDKPVIESIEKLSQTESTNSTAEVSANTYVTKRGARWFIDNQDRFHWYIPDDTPNIYLEVGTYQPVSPDVIGHIIHGVELENEVRDRINFIIYKAGKDMNNVMIKGYSRQPFSGLPNIKQCKRDWSTSIALNMKQQDGLTLLGGDEYDYPASYPHTPKWDRQQREVGNDADYNTNFKEEANKRAKENAQRIFQVRANPRWAGTIQLRGENIVPGDLINFTSTKHGLRNLLIRVKGVSHSINRSGWFTSINVEEDEPEIT